MEKNIIEHIHKVGTLLTNGYKEAIKEYRLENFIRLIGPDFRSIFYFNDLDKGILHKSLIQQEMIKRGINFTCYNNICFSHKEEDIDATI